MNARQRPVGGTQQYRFTIDNHEFVVHQAAAFGTVGGIVNQGHLTLGEHAHRIAAVHFVRGNLAVVVGVDQGLPF